MRTFRHNREHYQKITANLLPVLSMLTSGDLGRSLSPEPFDADDRRPIMNFEKIERAGHVLYMCLDSLPDPSVATAIGALALADLAARAGMRYNLGGYRRISLFVDEVSNVINQPLIEILNKGAEGGIFTTCAMQTLADLAKRLGSEDAARMALGNLNNLIALRSKDRPTQDFVVETFGKTGDPHHARGPEQRRRRAPGRLLVELLAPSSAKASRRWCRPTCWASCRTCSTSPRSRAAASSRGVSRSSIRIRRVRRALQQPPQRQPDDPRRRGGLVGLPAGAGSVPAIGASARALPGAAAKQSTRRPPRTGATPRRCASCRGR